MKNDGYEQTGVPYEQVLALKAYIAYLYEAERQMCGIWASHGCEYSNEFLLRGRELRSKIYPEFLPETYETYANTASSKEISTD